MPPTSSAIATTGRLGARPSAAAARPESATPVHAIQRVHPPPSDRCPKNGWVNEDEAWYSVTRMPARPEADPELAEQQR